MDDRRPRIEEQISLHASKRDDFMRVHYFDTRIEERIAATIFRIFAIEVNRTREKVWMWKKMCKMLLSIFFFFLKICLQKVRRNDFKLTIF